MRFKLDENLPADAATLLQALGHDVTTVAEQHLNGAPDAVVAATCRREERALITLDVGFGDLRHYPPADTAGIIVLRPGSQDKPTVLAAVRRTAALLSAEPLDGHLWVVGPRRVRIRGGS